MFGFPAASGIDVSSSSGTSTEGIQTSPGGGPSDLSQTRLLSNVCIYTIIVGLAKTYDHLKPLHQVDMDKTWGTIGIEAGKPGKTKSYGTQELLNEGVDTLSSEQLLSKVRIYIMIIVRFSKSMSVYSLAAYHMILRNSKSPGTTFNHKSLPQSFFASWFLQMCTFWLWRLGGKNWRKRNGLFSWVPCSFVYT